VNAVYNIQKAGLQGSKNPLMVLMNKVVGEIALALKEVDDPALLPLKKIFTDGNANAKTGASIRHNPVTCVIFFCNAIFKIENAKKRETARAHLENLLYILNDSFNAFFYSTDLIKFINSAIQTWQGVVLDEAEKEKVKLVTERDRLAQENRNVVEEKERLIKENQALKEESMSGRTSFAARAEKGKPGNNPIHDRLAMEAYWSRPLLTLLELIAVQYQYEMFFVERKADLEMAHRNKNGSLNGYQKPKKMSELLSACAKQLVDKIKTVEEITQFIETHPDLKNLDLAKRIQVARRDNFLGQRGPINQDVEDPLPGVTVPDDKIEDKAYVKGLYAKLSRISNMFGNKENSGLLPYDEVASKKYEGYALAIEKMFPYVVSIDDNTDIMALKGVLDIPLLALLYAINIQYRHQCMLVEKRGNDGVLSQKLSTLATELITETKTVEDGVLTITQDNDLKSLGLIHQMETFKARLEALDKADADQVKKSSKKQPTLWKCTPILGVALDEGRKRDEQYIVLMHRKLLCIASMCRNQGDNCLLPLNEALAMQYEGYVENLTIQCSDLDKIIKSNPGKRK
jgi:hypothetical protein